MKPTYAVKKARPPAKAATEADLLKDAEEKDQFQPNWVWNTLALNAAGKKSTHHSASGVSERPSAAYITGTNGARFHIDDAAARVAERLHAAAFTIGRDVYFGRNQYAPGTPVGDRLLRHELAHVAQANQGAALSQRGLRLAPFDHPAEREADRISETGGRPSVRVTAPTVFRHRATPRPVARLSRDQIFGSVMPPLPGLNLGEFQDYTEQTQADWFVHPTLTVPDRTFLWQMIHMLHEGSHIRLGIGDVKLDPDLRGVGNWPALRAYCRARSTTHHTLRLFPPPPPLADRIALGQTLLDLEAIIPPAVLEVTVSQSQLQRLQAAPPMMALLRDYWTRFEPFLEQNFTPAPAADGPEFQRVLAFLTTISGTGLAPLLPLQGASAPERWVRDLHRFPLPMLNQLVTNLGVINGRRPLILIIHSGHDPSASFQISFRLFSDLILNVGVSRGSWWPGDTDRTNLVLMIEGPTALADITTRIPRIATTWGHIDGARPRHIDQVVIAGHGSGRSISLAGVGPAAVVGGNVTYPGEEQLVAGTPVAQALLDTLLANMDRATARILYAGCLVGSRSVAAGTPAAAIPAAIAADQSLAAYTESRVRAAGARVVPGVTVQAARADVGMSAVRSLYDPATGLLQPDYPFDPNAYGSAATYTETGMEPTGLFRAAVEVAATAGVVAAERMLRTRIAMRAMGNWYDTITRLLVTEILRVGVNIELLNETANMVEVPFLVIWPQFHWVNASAYVRRLNPHRLAAEVYAGLHATTEYTVVTSDDRRRLRLIVDQGDYVRTGVAATLLAGIGATGWSANEIKGHLDITATVLGTREAPLMPLVGAPTAEQIRLALAWFALDPANAHVRAFLSPQVVVAPGVPPAFNVAVSAEITRARQSERDILVALNFALVAGGAPPVGGGPAPPLANVRVPGDRRNTVFVDPHPYVATVIAPIANIRPSPSMVHAPIGARRAGDTLNVSGFTHDWAAVDMNGRLGFVHRTLISPP